MSTYNKGNNVSSQSQKRSSNYNEYEYENIQSNTNGSYKKIGSST